MGLVDRGLLHERKKKVKNMSRVDKKMRKRRPSTRGKAQPEKKENDYLLDVH